MRKPADIPEIPSTIDPATGRKSINGGQALSGAIALYDVAGELRAQVLSLQAWVRTLIGEDPAAPAKKPKGER